MYFNVIVSKNKTFFVIKHAYLGYTELKTRFKTTECKDSNDIIFIVKTSLVPFHYLNFNYHKSAH